jgi:flagellar basal-body rod protein FlgG
MDLALAIARSGLEAQHQNIEIISNNLANASTTAFKKSHAAFQDLPYQVIKAPGSPTSIETNSPSGLVLGTGTKLIGNTKVYKDGNPVITEKPLDIAIHGRGFLQVQLPNGGNFAYTRAGALQVNETGQLVDGNGYAVQPAITIPQGAEQISISNDGIITAMLPGGSTTTQVGQLQLADFINPDGLQPIGSNLYLATVASGSETLGNPDNNGYGQTFQGQLEGSNVSVVEEMVNLIEAQRAFEVTSKAVSAVDNMMQNLSRQT